jgi:polyhydroxyalkanoate synthesis regulator protein
MFERTFSMFKPFAAPRAENAGGTEPEKAAEPAAQEDNIDDLRRQMKEMQDRLERMSKEPKKEE